LAPAARHPLLYPRPRRHPLVPPCPYTTLFRSPSAADTNENGDFTRDLFTQGKLGLFQSGPYSLPAISEGVADSFEWALAAPVSGPEGPKSLVHGVVAVGNAKADEDQQAGITELLTWLGSKEGQLPLAEKGVSFPGHVDAQDA